MKNLAHKIWNVAQKVLNTHGNKIDSMDLIENKFDNDITITIYHGNGHCFELQKEYICQPEDVNKFENVESDGYCYTFIEPWDEYIIIGKEKALELLKEYTIE